MTADMARSSRASRRGHQHGHEGNDDGEEEDAEASNVQPGLAAKRRQLEEVDDDEEEDEDQPQKQQQQEGHEPGGQQQQQQRRQARRPRLSKPSPPVHEAQQRRPARPTKAPRRFGIDDFFEDEERGPREEQRTEGSRHMDVDDTEESDVMDYSSLAYETYRPYVPLTGPPPTLRDRMARLSVRRYDTVSIL
jgi:hypothetical protein